MFKPINCVPGTRWCGGASGVVAAIISAGLTSTIAPASAQAASAISANDVIEEVLVTSRRREESVQDVPMSVTVFTGEQLEQIKPVTLRDFDGLAPNVYVGMNTAGPSASALFIRGVGYADIEKTQSPQVGVILDGLQIGSSTGQLIDTFDVESLEINRGPQGVLFGKNTIAGNIVVNRVRPQFNEFGVKISGEAGNYESTNFKGRVNIPLIDDKLALKVGMIKRDRDGYYDNLTLGGSQGDVDYFSATTALRWAPTDTFEAILTYDGIDDDSDIPPQDPRFDGDDPFDNRADKREPTNYDVDQLGLRMLWDINDDFTLHSITGYHDASDKVNQDFDGAAIDGAAIPFAQLHTLRDQDYKVFTQEVRLDWAFNDSIDLLFGVYYFDSDLDFNQRTNNVLQLPPVAIDPSFAGLPCATINTILEGITGASPGLRPNPGIGDALCQFPNARSTQVAGEDVESTAVFGSVTWQALDNLELSIGARYIDEQKDAKNSYFDHSTGEFDVPGVNEFDFSGYPTTPGTAYSVDDSWDDTVIEASANWAITDSNRAYVTYREGFRSGGFSIRSAGDPSQAGFEPEDAWQVEIGIKNEFFDNRLLANLAYFYLERSDAQFSSIITLPPGSIPGTTTIINNGGDSEIQGVELESTWLATEELTFTFNIGYLDVDNKAFALPCDVVDGCATGVPGVTDPSGTPRELGGNDDSRQPEWNYNIVAGYDRQIGPGVLAANVGYKRVGEFLLVNTGGGADQRLFDGDYDSVDARIAYAWTLPSGDLLTVSAFGKNLTDEEWKEQALFLGGPNTGFQGWGAPRTYALELIYEH